MRHSTGKPTKAQADRFVKMKEAGCILCHENGWPGTPPEIHHLTDCGRRRGHDFTIALCPYHHRGVPNEFCSAPMIGPSVSCGSKVFRAFWGADDELLAYQNKLIGETDVD